MTLKSTVTNFKIQTIFKNSSDFISYVNDKSPLRGYYPGYILSQKHEFHLVDPSPWPFMAAIGALSSTVGGVLYMHGYVSGFSLLSFGFIIILFVMFVWWRDIIREGTFEGQHTLGVADNLKLGMILFIVSEIMFFFAFFWAFFSFECKPNNCVG